MDIKCEEKKGIIKSFNFEDMGGCSVVDLKDGFELRDKTLFFDSQPIAKIEASCSPEGAVIETYTKQFEVYGCKYCGAHQNVASIIISLAGTARIEPCEACRTMIEDMVTDPFFQKPEHCDTVEDCIQYILGEIRIHGAFIDFNQYFDHE